MKFLFPDKAATDLISLKKKIATADRWEHILAVLVNSFDPDRALGNLLRFTEQVSPSFWSPFIENRKALDAYLAVFSGSQCLTEILLDQWDELQKVRFQWFDYQDEAAIRADLKKRIQSDPRPSSILKAVKHFKNYWYLNIGARDLLRLDNTELVLKRLSLIADICLETLYGFCYRELEKKHGTPLETDEQGRKKKSTGVIMGMGKLGGRELNFSSDIDLIFLHSSDNGETVPIGSWDNSAPEPPPPDSGKKISLHEFFTRLARKVTRIIGEELKIFRVDLDLRPEGKSGAITQCLPGAEIYYESWGQTWERMALIKARPVAGDRELGDYFLETVRPFVYRKYLDESSFNEIRGMRDRIKQKLTAERKNSSFDVKLGDGGIREIEFIVQSFQLIYGGKIAVLQNKSTVETLHELAGQGFLPSGEAADLHRAYLFLREVENRIQMLHACQTHLLPRDKNERNSLAAKMEFGKPPGDAGWNSFMHRCHGHTEKVTNIFDKLFLPCPPSSGKSPARKRNKTRPPVSPQERLSVEAFKNPAKIRSLITLLKEGCPQEHSTVKARELLDRLIPCLLSQIKSQPEPETTLNRFEEFTRGYGAREMLFGFLLENKPILALLIQILGTGGILCDRLIQFPGFLGLIAGSDAFWESKSFSRMAGEIAELTQQASSIHNELELLAKYKLEEEFRIGFRLVVKNPDPLPIFKELSMLATLYIERIFQLACREISPAETSSTATKIAIIALGKFGGEELDFGSDLDIVFVSADCGEEADSVLFHRVCRKIIALSQTVTRYGIPYRIDLDLRPYGKSGALVVPVSAFKDYCQRKARPWERMAWIRSEVIVGEGEWIDLIREIIRDFVYSRGLDKNEIDEIDRVWWKVHQEKNANSAGRVSLKFGSGGLFDLEFIIQLLQLKWGDSCPEVQSAHTHRALLALEKNKRLPAAQARELQNAYLFLRNLESRLRLTRNQPGDWIGLNNEQWDKLSKQMQLHSCLEIPPGEHLQETFLRITLGIKQIKTDTHARGII